MALFFTIDLFLLTTLKDSFVPSAQYNNYFQEMGISIQYSGSGMLVCLHGIVQHFDMARLCWRLVTRHKSLFEKRFCSSRLDADLTDEIDCNTMS